MLPGAMQDAIKARAARAKKSEFKDPYVKPKMSKEDFLAEKKSRGLSSPAAAAPMMMTGGTVGPSVDLSPIIQGQQTLQAQMRQLTEQVQRLSSISNSNGNSNSNQSTTTAQNNESARLERLITDRLDSMQQEIKQNQRQVTRDLLDQVEDIVRNAVLSANQQQNKNGTTSSSSPDMTAEVSKLKREVSQLKSQVTDLEEENQKLRKLKSQVTDLEEENQKLRNKQQQQSAVTTTTTKTTSAPLSPKLVKKKSWKKPATSVTPTSSPVRNSKDSVSRSIWKKSPTKTTVATSSSSSELQVKETIKSYKLTLAMTGSANPSDLNITYGSGALQVKTSSTGQPHKFTVDEDKIDTSGISATLQADGKTLEIIVPKK